MDGQRLTSLSADYQDEFLFYILLQIPHFEVISHVLAEEHIELLL